MRRSLIGCVLVLGAAQASADETKKIDLRTTGGVEQVKGQWKYHDVKIVEVDTKAPDGHAIKTYNIDPRAEKPEFDDSQWPVVDPTTLANPRGGGQVCFAWYRLKLTLPEGVSGKTVSFVTTVDDYGEVWVDGKINYGVGQSGGAIVAGFNAANRVELKDPRPGKTYSIAVFGINGPISVVPSNRIFLRDTFLEIKDK